jgi:hypothetical protein
LENIIPRHDTIHLHQERLEKILPRSTPRFQLYLQTLHAGRGLSSCKIVMIKCDKQNINQLINDFDNLNRGGVWKFFLFNLFNVFTPGEKVIVIKNLVHWCTNHRSLLLKGFSNNKYHIKMIQAHQQQDMTENTTTDSSNILQQTAWGDYLRNRIKASNGEPMLEYGYPLIDGTREFIVALHQHRKQFNFLNYSEQSYIEI